MTFKITIDPKTKRLLDGKSNALLNDTKKQFAKRGPDKVKQAIVQDMIKGISPVQGAGRWVKYSNSYKEEIRKNKSKRMKKASPSKRITPINLRLTGALHKSLSTWFTGNSLVIQFKHFLADIHNRRGAGKSKIIRRLLPTKNNETFNRTINTVLFNEVKKAVDFVAKQFTRQ